MDNRPALAGLPPDRMVEVAQALGQPSYRGRQLTKWVYQKAARSFEEMADLPAAFRTQLEEHYRVSPLVVADHKTSRDGVEKLLVHNGDEQVYECVLLPYADRVSCCISSQVGCPMGCTFCATGLGGFDRNLTAAEIIGQYLLLQSLSPRRVSHVVFMGMGEPLLNLEALVEAMRLLHEEVGLSYRHLTVSTVGLVPQIRQLARLKLPIHLALSLHSPLDSVRETLMPVNHKWPVAEVMQAMREYQAATGRKVTFEYLLIDQVNDTPDQAEALARLVKGLPCFVNLIPFNWVDTGQGFRRPERERVAAFRRVLEKFGVEVAERVERGHDIAAACGQLAGQHTGRFGKRGLTPLRVE
ncbi:MAG: 23S rRNA (adenine(2503)-C(2))-methyltransferase RlmN [Fimbriimonadaceae bacterium]|nr:23S rRNA (adenine(2503)-C(2))-methyltransferase RlmN [Fimbriimonadaceae bacterium]QYK56232.1 MAG: 23S rRNA (adenine(2503)-C(2))-methyltransferase RlmN [Fimbriimonadaceae bacterium]